MIKFNSVIYLSEIFPIGEKKEGWTVIFCGLDLEGGPS